ncbi:MAG: tyrosine-type recombinase/integrase [Bradyrhizobium sp.]
MRIVWFRDRFYAYERTGTGSKRTSLGTKDRAVAERRLIYLQALRRRKATTVTEMYQDYRTDRGPRLASQETLRFAWARLLPVFGHLRPDQITRALTRAYAAKETRRGVGASSIRRDLGVLSAVVRYSDKASPAIIELPPAPPPRSLYLTREEYRALRDAAQLVPHLHLFVWLAYRTGGRASAILELEWARVDFERGQIRLGNWEVRAKGRATVPMREDLADILREARRAAVTDYVIEYGGKPVRSVKRAFKAAAERAGLSRASGSYPSRRISGPGGSAWRRIGIMGGTALRGCFGILRRCAWERQFGTIIPAR